MQPHDFHSIYSESGITHTFMYLHTYLKISSYMHVYIYIYMIAGHCLGFSM